MTSNQEERPVLTIQARVAAKLDDLRDWVLHELTLPEEERVPLGRLDVAARSYLGEFNARARSRAQRGVELTA